MEDFFPFNYTVLWAVVLVNLALTIKLVSRIAAATALQEEVEELNKQPEIATGIPAPHFEARSTAGMKVALDDFRGRAIVLVFLSPHCGHCRSNVPTLAGLAPLAKKNADVDIVLVSDSSVLETQRWISSIEKECGLKVSLTMLIAPPRGKTFQRIYNPRGYYPYFCQIDKQGIVQARGVLGSGEWSKLRLTWEDKADGRLPMRHSNSIDGPDRLRMSSNG